MGVTIYVSPMDRKKQFIMQSDIETIFAGVGENKCTEFIKYFRGNDNGENFQGQKEEKYIWVLGRIKSLLKLKIIKNSNSHKIN